MKRWIVRPGAGATVADVLVRMGERDAARAIADGRVFVARRRVARADHAVTPGDEVTLGEPRARADDVAILFHEDGLVACAKPAGIPTVADHAGASHALVASVARAIGRKDAELRVTSRLDREVSGVVVFALDAAAEERLRSARAEGTYVRRYVALASCAEAKARPGADAFVWDVPIGAGRDARHRAANGKDAKAARTVGMCVECTERVALLALEPQTGRTHQLRVHAAHSGMPLLGDRDYGGPTRLTAAGGRVVPLPRIALHCARVSVAGRVATAPIPDDLRAIGDAAGIDAAAWTRAIEASIPR